MTRDLWGRLPFIDLDLEHHIVEPVTPHEALANILERHVGVPNTPTNRDWFRAHIEAWARQHDLPVPPIYFAGSHVHVGRLTAEAFEALAGYAPVDDALERARCLQVGEVGHLLCGWCDDHGMPRAGCGCVQRGA